MLALSRVLNLSFAIERCANRIGKRTAGVVNARMADEVDVVHEAIVQARKSAIGLRAMGIELFDAGRIQIEP